MLPPTLTPHCVPLLAAGEGERATPGHDGPPAHATLGAKAFQPTGEFAFSPAHHPSPDPTDPPWLPPPPLTHYISHFNLNQTYFPSASTILGLRGSTR